MVSLQLNEGIDADRHVAAWSGIPVQWWLQEHAPRDRTSLFGSSLVLHWLKMTETIIWERYRDSK